ncbi:MAG: sigma 54-interacting transcriptional regulator [Acidobacteriota bacterium]|nr:sigma 54-interacting transcriptional regulator [Acidobacteriota bacterium]
MSETFHKINFIILAKIGQKLADSAGLRDSLGKTLATLHESDLFARSFIALYEPQTEKLSLYASEGFNVNEYRRLENRLNKSFVAGNSGNGALNGADRVLIDKTSPEASFDFISPREAETSFLGVPIVLGKRKAGFLGVEVLYNQENDFESLFGFLAVIAAMISQALKSQSEIATEKEKLFEETSHLQQELREKYDFNNLIGNSGPMRQIYAQVSQVARSNATVLLRGESGTGKEMIANAIHYNSLRAKKPIIKINCAALPETLIEAELFGYEKGAFTGANQRKKGRFELADGGTLFLDEIGDLPLQTQVKLLRVLQEREFERLGGTETLKVNVRLVTATNKNLEAEIASGNFREDLFYRLNVFTIFLPPLRERKSDILLLAEHFLEKYEKIHGKIVKRISTPAIDMLTAYHYPGNVRELENAIERAVVVCDGNVIHGHHLPPTLQTAEVSDTVTNVTLESAVSAFERDLIQDALKTTGGNCAKAANMLNTTERIINYKIKKYGIKPKRFRA